MMIDFFWDEYVPYKAEELDYLKSNAANKNVIEEHIALLERRYRRFSNIYKAGTMLIKLVPVLALMLFLIMPTYYKIIFISALSVLVIYEVVKGRFFPRRYFESILSNILVLKSINKFSDDNGRF